MTHSIRERILRAESEICEKRVRHESHLRGHAVVAEMSLSLAECIKTLPCELQIKIN